MQQVRPPDDPLDGPRQNLALLMVRKGDPAMNSRDKGRRGEIELCKLLVPYWPDAVRNLDQFGNDKRDALGLPGLHFQIKRVEKLNIWNALDQAVLEASGTDVPVLAFRRNFTRCVMPSRSKWFGAMELDELLPLLKLREA